MLVHGKEKIEDFIKKHTDAKQQTLAWLAEAESAEWQKPEDIKSRYKTASFLQRNVVIFNIRGNNYRIAVRAAYNSKIIKILWAGTHAEYDKIDFKEW